MLEEHKDITPGIKSKYHNEGILIDYNNCIRVYQLPGCIRRISYKMIANRLGMSLETAAYEEYLPQITGE